MNLRLSKMQKAVLNMLLDTYENSATYRGTAAKNQSFSIKPEKVYPDYNGDYTDSDEVNRFNRHGLHNFGVCRKEQCDL